jgi:GAF domain-containing protein
VARTKVTVHTADISTEKAYIDRDPLAVVAVEVAGIRTLLCVPMLKEQELVGVIVIYRREVRPFTDKQIALLQNFAAQAVIAIENARLLNELRQRTTDLSEALEQQIATSEVLKVISSSPGELEPVFQAMLENAVRICDAKFGTLFRYDNGAFAPAAQFGVPAALVEFHRQRGSFQPAAGTNLHRMWLTKDVVRVADDSAEPVPSPAVEFAGARSLINVPMLKENALIGAISIHRQEVRPFTDKQVALLQNFAAQAVIAIENTRLLNELRESLQQQTATSDVLSVISKSPGDLEPVFQAMLANATRICEANFGILQLYENGGFRVGSTHNVPAAFAQAIAQRDPLLRPGPLHSLSRVAATKQLVHISDYIDDPAYKKGDPAAVRLVELGGARSVISVPMLKENELIGVIVIYRQEPRPFTDKQIALLQNFAAQAVIAIENTRLLNELRQSLEQQTATADVLRVISSSPGELQPVFEAMLQNAVRICDAKFGNLALFENDGFRFVAQYGAPPKYRDARQREPFIRRKARGNLDRVIKTKQVDHVADMAAEEPDSGIVTLGGARTLLTVPMLKDNELVGMIAIYRQEVRPFSEKQIELLQNFAAQAVIAIENARLLTELRQRTTDLAESLEQQTATSEVLRVISSSPGELKPVFQAMLENATRISEAKFGVLYLREGDGLRAVALHGAPLAYAEERKRHPVVYPARTTLLGQAVATKRTRQTADIQDEADYAVASGNTGAQLAKLGGARTVVAVPMVREDESIGAIVIYRQEVRPF